MIYVIAMNIFSISWENLRVILLLPWRRKYFINAFYMHLVEKMQQFVLLSWSQKWQRDSEKCVSFHKTEQHKTYLCFFIYQSISFPRSGKVSSDLCYFHKVKSNTKRNRKLWKTFFYKSRNYCDIFISTKQKMLHQ